MLRRIWAFLNAPLPWANTLPFQSFLRLSLVVIGAILAVKILERTETRLVVYVFDVAVIFLLGFVLLEGRKGRALASRATRLDLGIAIVAIGADVIVNLGAWSPTGYPASRQPGFGDAIALILVLFIAFYGIRNIRPMIAPISLLIALAGITVFISNEDPTFYAYVGRYFVSFTVWISGALLSLMGYHVVTGPDYFQILGLGPTGIGGLNVGVGIRCGGLDVATVYSLLIGYFAWQTRLGNVARLSVAMGAAVGALLLNGLRVVFITILFLSYPVDLVEAFHTNLGDLIFLGYAAGFIVGLARYR